MEYSFEIKIPMERVAVLIGSNGETKAQLEESTKSNLDVDSKEGDVIITGSDALLLYTAKDIVRAIGRGFNPRIAMKLLKIDYAFDLVSLADFADSKSGLARVKGRVIGQGGKTRKLIEELTETNICVYGKTIGIIGSCERTILARRAINMLLQGSRHGNVYRWMEQQRRKFKQDELRK